MFTVQNYWIERLKYVPMLNQFHFYKVNTHGYYATFQQRLVKFIKTCIESRIQLNISVFHSNAILGLSVAKGLWSSTGIYVLRQKLTQFMWEAFQLACVRSVILPSCSFLKIRQMFIGDHLTIYLLPSNYISKI